MGLFDKNMIEQFEENEIIENVIMGWYINWFPKYYTKEYIKQLLMDKFDMLDNCFYKKDPNFLLNPAIVDYNRTRETFISKDIDYHQIAGLYNFTKDIDIIAAWTVYYMTDEERERFVTTWGDESFQPYSEKGNSLNACFTRCMWWCRDVFEYLKQHRDKYCVII